MEKSIEERENIKFEAGLSSKVKLSLYKIFSNKYFHGVSVASV